MKSFLMLVAPLLLAAISLPAKAQDLIWANLAPEHRNIISPQISWDYSLGFGLGYTHQLKTKLPSLLTASYSSPFGEKIADDFKIKAGGQVRVARFGDFQVITSLQAIYRRYENPLVTLQNVGSELRGVVGYYRPKWFAAGELGYDWAMATHFRHSADFRENTYDKVQDGWASSPTGGNFSYGLQTGYTFGAHDLIFKIGGVVSQGFETTPMIPFYAQLGFNFKLKSSK